MSATCYRFLEFAEVLPNVALREVEADFKTDPLIIVATPSRKMEDSVKAFLRGYCLSRQYTNSTPLVRTEHRAVGPTVYRPHMHEDQPGYESGG